MILIRNTIEIAELINKQLIGEISEEEESVLNHWRKDPENEQVFNQIKEGLIKGEHYKKFKKIDLNKGWQNNKNRLKLDFFWLNIRKSMQVAAIITLFIAVSGGVYVILPKKTPTPTIVETPIVPGKSQAALTLADGSVVNLTDDRQQIEEAGAEINNSGGTIAYTLNNEDVTASAMNTLDVPRGGEYRLILPDGSKVWLNSVTRLKYPVRFDKNQRKVYVKGEAYFEVKHIDNKPFKVVTENGVEIEVLGTKFNIMAYNDADNIETTLVDGAVKVNTADNKSVKLEPGEQARVSGANFDTKVLKVNTGLYTAWTKGRFVFEQETLENILAKLSRWYDFDIFYLNPDVKKKRFSANLRRYDDISSFIRLFAQGSAVDLVVNDRTVLVRERVKKE